MEFSNNVNPSNRNLSSKLETIQQYKQDSVEVRKNLDFAKELLRDFQSNNEHQVISAKIVRTKDLKKAAKNLKKYEKSLVKVNKQIGKIHIKTLNQLNPPANPDISKKTQLSRLMKTLVRKLPIIGNHVNQDKIQKLNRKIERLKSTPLFVLSLIPGALSKKSGDLIPDGVKENLNLENEKDELNLMSYDETEENLDF